MKKRKIAISIVFIFLFALISPVLTVQAKGQIDFSTENYEDFSTSLDGEWTFFPNEYLTPISLKQQQLMNNGEKVVLPHKLDANTRFATYSTTISFPSSFIGKRVGLVIPFQYSAYQLYVDDRLVLRNGFEQQHISKTNVEIRPETPTFIVGEKDTRITIQVTALTSVNAGLNQKIGIGNIELIEQKIDNLAFMQAFLIGAVLLIASVSLLLFIFRKQERAFLAFSLFCFATGVWGLFSDNYLYTVLYNDLNWDNATRATYILPMIVMGLYVYYISKTFRNVISKYLMGAFQLIIAAIVIICLLADNGIYQNWYLIINAVLTPFYVYFIVRTLIKVNWKDKLEALTAIGVVFIFSGATHDMIVLGTGQSKIQLSFIMIGLFIGIQSFILSYQFSIQWKKIEQLNNELMDLTSTLDDKIKMRTKQLEDSNVKLRSLAYLDGLTGAFNRHYFNKNLENIYKKYLETGEPIAVIIIDVDEFKRYNDYYGHVSGDRLLKKLVLILSQNIPLFGEFTRYGGEEFALILDRTTADEAIEVAETLRKAIEEAEFEHLGRDAGLVTISVGGVAIQTTQFEDVNEFLAKADEQLYISKNSGRNRVSFKDLG